MLHLIIGTKAQYLKMLPLMTGLENRGAPFRLIDTGQHAATSARIRRAFGLREPDLFLSRRKGDVARLGTLLAWNTGVLTAGLARCRGIVRRGDCCLVHGDTVSTLQGSLIAKARRAVLVHVEAGERTHNIRSPFPEEIIRRAVDRLSDICFTSSQTALSNLKREKVRARLIDVGHNTIFDTVRVAEKTECPERYPDDYALVSIHRSETVYSRSRMGTVVSTALKAARQRTVLWGLHEVTRRSLERFRLLPLLEEERGIELRGLFDYVPFIHAMKGARFLITDGGGPQEESHLLNVPCLLMRTETERDFHRNVTTSRFEEERIEAFLAGFESRRAETPPSFESPSEKIVDELLRGRCGSPGEGAAE